jgi:hypothetical protein
MRYWKQFVAGALVATAMVARPTSGIQAEPPGARLQRAGSEVYIEQPPKNAFEKSDPTLRKGAQDGTGDGNLKPAEGPEQPSARQPEACDRENTPSQACYAATQQARPIPR